jgi:hypothetical protein
VEVTVCPSPCHEDERQDVIDRYTLCTDIREQVVAVGAAPVLITAERIADARYGTSMQSGRRVQVDGRLVRGYLERDGTRVEPETPRGLDEIPAGIDLERQNR